MMVCVVAIATPMRRCFDYLLPESSAVDLKALPGCRVKVPFGKSERLGVVIEVKSSSDFKDELKPISCLLDDYPVINESLMQLSVWAAGYYQHSLGEVVQLALPTLLRKPVSLSELLPENESYFLTEKAHSDELKGARQKQLLTDLQTAEAFNADSAQDWTALKTKGYSKAVVKALIDRQCVTKQLTRGFPRPLPNTNPPVPKQIIELNSVQKMAVDAVTAHYGQFYPCVLDGVTGSGKTEVYLTLIEQVLARGERALVLLPEIGLTPQTLKRFEHRLNTPIGVLHSGLTDNARFETWVRVRAGEYQVVLGTRSAMFAPIDKLGLIVIDEEHDASFKQMEGLRYSARDLAIKYASMWEIPIVLGSATPSLETLHKVIYKDFNHLELPRRAGDASMPSLDVVDLCNQQMIDGLSMQLVGRIKDRLSRGEQVLLFINRRGYAPVLICHSCGWTARCSRCEANMTLHYSPNHLHCHHCDSTAALPHRCPGCGARELTTAGSGTEKIEQSARELFSGTPVVRIDSDTVRKKGALEKVLTRINSGESMIIVGTQMLAKGHHFPNVTLVALIDVDGALFSADFRAPERLAQLVVQVAGRAGRADKKGEVILQTHQSQHPMLVALLQHGYGYFAQLEMQERERFAMPPFGYMVLIRSSAHKDEHNQQFLGQWVHTAAQFDLPGVEVLGPVPAPMPRRAGRFRSQVLMQSADRKSLHRMLRACVAHMGQCKSASRVRWSVDVDPLELF